MKRIKLTLAVLLCAASIVYATDYNVLSSKAIRFFNQKEWASASAMYDLMIDQKPSICETYGYAITSAGMRNDSIAQLTLMDQSTKGLVPFDSLFYSVKKVSFSIGETQLYEHFLLNVKKNYQWLSRAIDFHLLEYYTFRNDAPNMIAYSKSMLNGMPDNINFLSTLAHGLMLDNQVPQAMDTYLKIIDIEPENHNALLQLGNYYQMTATDNETRQKALDFLQRAQKIKPTPHLANIISRLHREIYPDK